MDIINHFREIAANPVKYAVKLKSKNNLKFIGTFCSYVPEEIIAASGAVQFRILGATKTISKADAHLQSYCCSYIRRALEDALTGELDFLDGVVFPHTCDSIQRLSDIWRLNAKTGFHIDTITPVKLNTPSARDYMIEVVKKLKLDIEEKLNIKITSQQLKQASKTCNLVRKAIQRIYKIRQDNPNIISGPDMRSVIRAALVIEKNELIKLLTKLIQELENSSAPVNNKRVVLAGGVSNPEDIYSIIEDAGGSVVYEDLCVGARYFDEMVNMDTDIIIGIAERYLKKAICPAKHLSLESRGDRLVDIAKQNQAQGVIFIILKFCDPHSFDYPYIKKRIENEKIECLLLEIEDSTITGEQLRTRIQAFIEML